MPKGLWDANNVPKSKPSNGVKGNVTGFSNTGSGPSAAGGGTTRSAGGPGVSGGGGRGNIFGFGGTSFSSVSGGGGGGGLKTNGKSGTKLVRPGQKNVSDNSSGGSVVTPGKKLESGNLYVGSPVKLVRPLRQEEIDFLLYSAAHYVKLKNYHQHHVESL